MHLALRRRRTGIHHLAVRATRRMPSPSPGCLLKARAGGHRAVGNEWERLASAGAARNSPPVTGGSKYLVWTFAVPGVDPRRTRGAISAGPGRARPTHAGGLQPFSPSSAARVWEAGGGCVLRADAVPALARGRRAGGPGPRRACRLRCCVIARERCPASAPWRGRRLDRHREDVATYRERVRRPRAGRFPASPLSRPASLPEGRSAGSRAGAGNGQQDWQTV
jgi:hypothetical protein